MYSWSAARLDSILSSVPCKVTLESPRAANSLRQALYHRHKRLGAAGRPRISVRGAELLLYSTDSAILTLDSL